MNRIMIWLAMALVAPAFAATFDADTMALYPFMDGEAGSAVGTAAGSVTNAVDKTLYSGKAFSKTAYNWNAYGDVPASVSPQAVYSDDLPGKYIYDGLMADTPFLQQGEYQSIHLPDALAGYTNYTDNTGIAYCPPKTNATSHTVTPTFKSDCERPFGMSCVDFAGVDSAIAREASWTIEFFVKQGQVYTGGGQVLGFGNYNGVSFSKATFYSANYTWDRFTSCGGYYYLPNSQNIFDLGWYHVALTYTNGVVDTYVNHSKVITRSVTRAAVTNDTYALRIGDYRNHYPGTPFYGKVAALRVTKRVLSTDEMLYALDRERLGNLTITGDYAVPAEGATCQNLVINGAARITGGKLTVEGSISVNADATFANSGLEFAFANSTITVANGKTLNVDAVISGSQDFTVNGTGTAYFNAANTFTGKLTITGGIKLHAANDGAFGTVDGKTVIESSDVYGDSQLWFDGITTSEPIDTYFDSSRPLPRLCFGANTTNVLYGYVGGNGGRRTNFRFEAGSVNVFSNTWQDLGAIDSSGNAVSAETHFWGPVRTYRTYFGEGHFYFHAGMDVYGENYGVKMVSKATYIMCRTNVFCASESATAAYEGATLWFYGSGGTLDLNGYDQRFSHVNDYNTGGAGIITSAVPAVLHLDNTKAASKADTFPAAFVGKASLSVDGSRPLTLTGKSTSSGTLTVNAGAQVTLGDSGTWAGDVAIANAGTQTVMNAFAFSSNTVITIENGGTLELDINGQSAVIGKLVAGGTTYDITRPGRYGPTGSGADYEIEGLIGSGSLQILSKAASVYTWDAGGNDDNLATAGNWEGDSAPNFVEGMDAVVFGSAGERATVAANAKLSGITFNRSFTLAAGGGTLSLGGDGVNVESADPLERAVTNAAPTVLNSAQTWKISGTNTVFRQQGALTAAVYAPITLDGDGDIYLDGDNSGVVSQWNLVGGYTGTRGPRIYLAGDTALGSGKVRMDTHKSANTMIYFPAGHQVYNNEIEIQTDDRGNKGEMTFVGDADVTFNGKVSISTYNRSTYGKNAHITYAGGFDSSGTRSSLNDGDVLVFTNVPSKISHLCTSGYRTRIEIWTSNNTWKDTNYGIELDNDITLDLHAPYAVCTCAVSSVSMGNVVPRFLYWQGSSLNLRPTVNLNGFNQAVSYLGLKSAGEESTEGSPCVVTSAAPARLEVVQNISASLKMLAFAGKAGLRLSGTGTLTLTNTPSPTEGKLEIDGGHLVLDAGAAWPNVTEVEVGSGSLALNASNLFGKRTTALKLETGAILTLAADTVQQVRELEVNGVKLSPRRTYTKDSPELNGIVTGDGAIFVYGDGPGTHIILR